MSGPKNKFGLKGVQKSGSGFKAVIFHNGESVYISSHRTPEAAHAAYLERANEVGERLPKLDISPLILTWGVTQ